MFTGIIECTGKVISIVKEQENKVFTVQSPISHELKIDQSVQHNGVCLTVTHIDVDLKQHQVVAIQETLVKSNLGQLNEGNTVNLERCLKVGDRFDGHMVQGHVDQTAKCVSVTNEEGSWKFRFEYDEALYDNITVEKGSICVNGTSLTVVDSEPGAFSVAIIPYTFEHTQFKEMKAGDIVNLEFDILGKYIAKIINRNAYINLTN